MPSTLSPSTPIITILPSVEEPEKQKNEKIEEIAGKSQTKEEEAENGALVSRALLTKRLISGLSKLLTNN